MGPVPVHSSSDTESRHQMHQNGFRNSPNSPSADCKTYAIWHPMYTYRISESAIALCPVAPNSAHVAQQNGATVNKQRFAKRSCVPLGWPHLISVLGRQQHPLDSPCQIREAAKKYQAVRLDTGLIVSPCSQDDFLYAWPIAGTWWRIAFNQSLSVCGSWTWIQFRRLILATFIALTADCESIMNACRNPAKARISNFPDRFFCNFLVNIHKPFLMQTNVGKSCRARSTKPTDAERKINTWEINIPDCAEANVGPHQLPVAIN